jgi:putative transposase
MAESVVGLYKTEVIRRGGPWRDRRCRVRHARMVACFNHRRLLEPIAHVPPAEFEAAYYRKEGSREGAHSTNRASG